MEQWLETDEIEEAISALEMAGRSLSRVQEDLYEWRWVIISTHIALQGFMVCALRGSDGLNALKDKNAGEWLKAYRQEIPFPKEQLDSFLGLYTKIKTDAMCFYIHSKPFQPKGAHDSSIRNLNALRNKFIHFVPRMWMLDIRGLPTICLDSLEVMEFLAWECGNVAWAMNDNQQARAEKAFCRVRHELKELIQQYKALDEQA